MNKKRLINSIVVIMMLTAVDMLIKVTIDCFFMDNIFIPIEGFGFKPHLNITQMSIFNNELNLGVSTTFLIVLNIIFLPAPLLLGYYIQKNGNPCNSVYAFVNLMIAGEICSLLDKIIWGGSLDYIYFCGRWICDLKDIYLTAGCFVYIYCVIIMELRQNKEKKAIQEHNSI